MSNNSASLLVALVLLALAPLSAQTATQLATFAPTDIPEGIAVDASGNAYVSLVDRIMKVTPAGTVSTFATLPRAATPRLVGMKFDAAGNLYAAEGGVGIWRFAPDGQGSVWAAIPGAMFVNDLIFDQQGNIYATDSRRFAIYKIDPAGNAQVWSTDALLQPRSTPTFFPNNTVGPNGIAMGPDGHLYVVVSQAGRVVQIPITDSGTAGAARVFVENEMLAGGDGIAFHSNGDLYIALNIQDRIAVVKPDGRVSTLAAGGALSIPTTIAFGRAGAEGSLFVANNGHFFPGGVAAKKGVVRIDVGALADSAPMRNFATRGRVGPGGDLLVAGFTISGVRSKTVIIRGVGPALGQFGVTGALADPRLQLYSGATLVDSNDNWSGTAGFVALSASLGAFPLTASSRDAAIMITLQPGAYTAVVSATDNGTGIAMIEIYELP